MDASIRLAAPLVGAGRPQRVAGLMRRHGHVKSSLDVRALIAEP
ncbi:hypothetical protein ACU635_48380 [[Actinomadura] parvosata]